MTATTTERASAAKAGKPKARAGSLKGEVYRQARLWHGWLSALAFLALMFFSATGLILNHPEWLKVAAEKTPAETTVALTPVELAAAQQAPDPNRALAAAVGKHAHLLGVYQSGETLDGEAQIRTEGVRGASDLVVDLATGKVQVSTQGADAVALLNDLHRGKDAGAAWKLVIDASAILVLALSLVGYVLFFSLRFRLRTGLVLTGLSLATLVGVFVVMTP